MKNKIDHAQLGNPVGFQKKTKKYKSAASACITIFVAIPAYAQVTAPSTLLEEIVVTGTATSNHYTNTDSSTALGLDASILDTPLSIQSITMELLDDQQASSLWDGLKNVSGVASRGTNSGVNEDFVIRGFQLDPRRNYYRDGGRFYNQFSIDPNNLERLEVLKGPASILYGQLEPGGIINLVTPRLSATPSANLRLVTGSYEQFQGNGAVSGPVGVNMFYRLYGSLTDSGSYRDYVEQDRKYINPTLAWNISATTTLRFNMDWQQEKRTADAGIVAILDRPAAVPASTFYGDPGYKTEAMDNASGGVTLTHIWTPNLKQTSTVGYYDTSWDREQVSVEATRGGIVGLPGGPGYPGNGNTLLPRQIYDNEISYREVNTQHNFEYSLKGNLIDQKFLFGVSAYRYNSTEQLGDRVYVPANTDAQRIEIYNPEAYYGLVIPDTFALFRNSAREENNVGAHFQDMIALGDQWVVLAGVRYDSIEFDEEVTQSSGVRLLSRSDSSFSPRAGIVFKPVETLSLYASLTRSFSPRSGNRIINEPVSATAPITLDNIETVDPERAKQVEIGAKWSSADARFFATLAMYELTREDMVESNPRFTNYSVQIGEQTSRGIDLDLRASINDAIQLIGSYSYIDATIDKDVDRPQWEGNRLDNIPEHSGSLWVRYNHASGFGVGAGLFYAGEREGNLENDFQLPSYTRVDASVSWQFESMRFDVGVKNLFDEDYYLNSWRRDRIMPGSPRTFMGSVNFNW